MPLEERVLAVPALLFAATSSSSATVSEVVSVAILVYLLYQQRQIRVLKTTLLLPLVLAVVGLSSMLSDLKGHPLSTSQAAILVGLFVGDAVGLGTLRAFHRSTVASRPAGLSPRPLAHSWTMAGRRSRA